MPGKDIATSKSGEVAREAPPEFTDWINKMILEVETLGDENEFDPRDILAKTMTAATFDEVVSILGKHELPGAKNLIGIVHTVNGFDIRMSEKEDGLPVYLAVRAETDDGEELNYSVGAANVVALLWQARQFDRLPIRGTLQERETKSGNTLISFVPIPQRNK